MVNVVTEGTVSAGILLLGSFNRAGLWSEGAGVRKVELMDIGLIVALLGRSQLFGPLDEPRRTVIARQMRETSFSAGQVIFSRGDLPAEIYLVLEGIVRLSVLSVEGRELSFAHADTGSVFGEIAALDNGPRTADATAITPLRVAVLSKAALRSAIETMPAMAHAAITLVCGRLRQADSQLESIALHSIEVRLARYLLSQLQRQQGRKSITPTRLDLDISQTELALRIGASRPKVNAAIAKLEECGAIERKGRFIECNAEELEIIAAQ